MKDYEKMVNCNDTYCEYFDERMELNCAYSEDNSECIKTIEPLSSHAVLGEVEALRAENKRLRGLLYELLYAMADANSVATMQSSAKLFKKWYEDEKKKGFNFA